MSDLSVTSETFTAGEPMPQSVAHHAAAGGRVLAKVELVGTYEVPAA